MAALAAALEGAWVLAESQAGRRPAALRLAAAHFTRATPTARTTRTALAAPGLAARCPRINQTAFIMVVETEILIHASYFCTSLSSARNGAGGS